MLRSLEQWRFTAAIWLFLSSVNTAFPTTYNNNSLSSEAEPMCTKDTNWLNNFFDPNHCLDALYKLEDTDLQHYKTRDFEFLAPGAEARTRLNTIRLPRKYREKSCTIIFAMMSTLSEYPLPGQTRRISSYRKTDESKFSYLWSVAAWVDSACVDKGHSLGWCTTGSNLDIGVFFVATNSDIDKYITRTLFVANGNRTAGPMYDLFRTLRGDIPVKKENTV